MNYRRGFIRLWLAFSLIWTAWTGVRRLTDDLSCLYEDGPWCDHRTWSFYLGGLQFVLGPPALALIIGALGWIIGGFKRAPAP